MEKIKCEDEKIQFLGKIQDLGFIIFLNQTGIIEAVSDNISNYLSNHSPQTLIGKPILETYFGNFEEKDFIKNAIEEFKSSNDFKRITKLLEIEEQPFYLSISYSTDTMYLEFEKCINNDSSKTNIINNKLIELQNAEQDVWKVLSEILSQNLEVDRVMIYQFNEDSSGIVIAETLNRPNLDSYLGLNYPEFDIPKQARELYKTKHCRFIADTDSEGSTVVTLDNQEANLQEISIRRLSPIHLQYLKNAGFRSSISFSIIIKGELWGLVCCQHEEPKHIDLSIRNFSLMATNFAANKFQQLEDIERMAYLEEVQELELLLKEKVLLKSNIFHELKDFSKTLLHMLEADGIAIGFEDSIFLEGIHPEKESLRSQLPKLTELAKDHIYSTNALSNHLQLYEDFGRSIAGLSFAEIDSKKDFFIIWFRKEILLDREWAGKPEKYYEEDKLTGVVKPSPRTSFNVWREQVKGTSKKWSSKQMHFITRIRELLRDSMLNKAAEIDSLNTQLIEMNNALDTYAYTISHDLKNPLSAIKVSTEFLQYRQDVKPELLKKMSSNILDSVHIILNMLDKIHQFSKASSFNFEKEIVETENFVDEIIEMSKHRFGSNNVEVIVNNLLPVQGEKTLLYQLFLNIIGNAIKYSSKATSAKVIIDSFRTDNGIIYTISDNGIGMEEDELASIYEMFKRMSNSSGYEGSGIGMSIVKRIADKLGIDISIKSKLNEGTTVKLMFPA
ncbi:ATP-binding protein [Sphingobacterium daejeonense]|uniref:ATP-binding protein n=1 Tax=Sphingobacterium daejeonense TaxID=371142 RepID=UPI0010C438CB|nr:ATP-binding protein [Sphingobacterium daejeonense]VTQ00610.1 Phytochrome-like protein cph1 [Sphingobacterium daejeonense]